jgi:hypothetical protein
VSGTDDLWGREPEPLVPGVVQGLRTWGLALDRHSVPGLIGYGQTRWASGGEPTVATCVTEHGRERGEHSGLAAPTEGCTCGLYANHPWARDPNSDFLRVDGMGLEPDEVFGVVEAWGRIEVHEDGFRAEFARPIALFAKTGAELAWDVPSEGMAAEYRCELIRVDSVEELAAKLERFDGGLDRSFVQGLQAA